MSKNKKVTYNMIAASLHNKPVTVEIPICEGSDILLSVRTNLPMNDAMEFVENVVMSCIDLETSEYTPEAYDFGFRINVLSKYAGIDIPKDTLKDLSKAYSVAYETNIYQTVFEIIDHSQLNALENAIQRKIEYLRDLFISSAAHSVNSLMDKMQAVIDGSNDIMEQVNSESFQEAMNTVMNQFREEPSEETVSDEEPREVNDNVVMITRKPNA